MKLLFQKHVSDSDINKNFQKHFPFLKLKFYNSDHPATHRLYTGQEAYRSIITKDSIAPLPSVIEFSPSDTIEQFEQLLQKEMGLCVRVFRKIHEYWTDTRQTKHLSLHIQNSLGAVQFHEQYNDYTLFL